MRACIERLIPGTLPEHGLAAVDHPEADLVNTLHFIALSPECPVDRALPLVDLLTDHFVSGEYPKFATLPRHVLFFMGRYPDGKQTTRTRKLRVPVFNNEWIDFALYVEGHDATMGSAWFQLEAVLDHISVVTQHGHYVIHLRRGSTRNALLVLVVGISPSVTAVSLTVFCFFLNFLKMRDLAKEVGRRTTTKSAYLQNGRTSTQAAHLWIVLVSCTRVSTHPLNN